MAITPGPARAEGGTSGATVVASLAVADRANSTVAIRGATVCTPGAAVVVAVIVGQATTGAQARGLLHAACLSPATQWVIQARVLDGYPAAIPGPALVCWSANAATPDGTVAVATGCIRALVVERADDAALPVAPAPLPLLS